jgi:hypothetical protein
MLKLNHRLREEPHQEKKRKDLKKMYVKPIIVTEIHTNTIYMPESSARDIRKPKATPASTLFRKFKKLYPDATVVVLTNEEFDNRFAEMGIQALKESIARFVITKDFPERTFLHYQEIA